MRPAWMVLQPAAFVLLLASCPAWAVYHESISIIGTDAPSMAGSKAVFTPTAGEPVEGRVERRDGGFFLLFDHPGDRPVAGTIEMMGRSFPVPAHRKGEALVLNLDTASIVVVSQSTAAVQGNNDRRWEISLGGFLQETWTDQFTDTIGASADELRAGLSGISASSNVSDNADDHATGFAVKLRFSYALSQDNHLYARFGYAETGEFDGSVRGTATVPGATLNAMSDAESKIDVYSLALGYIRDFGIDNRWRWNAGIGGAHAKRDDSFSSSQSVNGMEISALSGSEKDSDDGFLVETGLEYRFTDCVSAAFNVDYVDGIFGDSLLRAGIGIYLSY